MTNNEERKKVMPEAQELRISSLSDLAELENSFNYNIKHIASKRGFDILFSLVCLIVGLPLYFFLYHPYHLYHLQN